MATFGIDLSHHQTSAFQPWDRYAGKVDFVICRASYGGLLRDKQVQAHMQHARAIGATVGLYQFYRPTQSVDQHWDQLRAVADLVQLDDGDLVPALDIERDPLPKPGLDVTPEWSGPCEELVCRIVDTYGDALVYITQREWGMLGKPAPDAGKPVRWVRECESDWSAICDVPSKEDVSQYHRARRTRILGNEEHEGLEQ